MMNILKQHIESNRESEPEQKIRRSKFANFDRNIVLKYHYQGESIRHIAGLIKKNEGITISKS